MADQCGLDGCDEPVRVLQGRATGYCSPEHRAVARRLRRAAHQADAAEVTNSGDVAQQEQPSEAGGASVQALDSADQGDWAEWSPRLRSHVDGRAKRPSSRRLASAAAAVVLAGTAALWIAWPSPDRPSAPMPAQAEYLPPAAQEWEPHAQLTLASLDRQLDLARSALSQWEAVPQAQRPSLAPAQVAALRQREAALQPQRDALATQLASARALAVTESALKDASANLTRLDADLDAPLPPASTVQRQLADQQRAVRGQVAALTSQAQGLENDVAAAAHAPRPDGTDSTTPLANAVRELADHPPSRQPSGEATPSQDPALAQRRDAVTPSTGSDAVGAAPPRPGSRDERHHVDATGGEGGPPWRVAAPPPTRDDAGSAASAPAAPAPTDEVDDGGTSAADHSHAAAAAISDGVSQTRLTSKLQPAASGTDAHQGPVDDLVEPSPSFGTGQASSTSPHQAADHHDDRSPGSRQSDTRTSVRTRPPIKPADHRASSGGAGDHARNDGGASRVGVRHSTSSAVSKGAEAKQHGASDTSRTSTSSDKAPLESARSSGAQRQVAARVDQLKAHLKRFTKAAPAHSADRQTQRAETAGMDKHGDKHPGAQVSSSKKSHSATSSRVEHGSQHETSSRQGGGDRSDSSGHGGH